MEEAPHTIPTLAELQLSFHNWLTSHNISDDASTFLTALGSIMLMLLLAYAIDFLLGLVLRKLMPLFVSHVVKEEQVLVWQASLRKHTLAKRSAHIVAALVVYHFVPQVLNAYPSVVQVVRNLIEGYLILVIVLTINALLRAAVDVYRRYGWAARLPLQFISQTIQTIIGIIGTILVISVIFDKPVGVLITGLAGMTALLMLVFRDTLLGWVSGMQIVNNDLVREGDWIESSKYGADGAVVDIGLITVKVRNWDKTVTSIPSYSLINDGFKNWRGMYDSGGRRIKRSLPIDMSSICFCNDNMLERLRNIEILRDYIDQRLEEIEVFNQSRYLYESEPTNGRRLTNIGVYRAYLTRYLQYHTDVNQDMTLMVRQLPPGPEGIGVEIYAFSSNQKWTEYEAIQADIFDHALSVLPTFDLKVFQYPTSGSLNSTQTGPKSPQSS